jgi:hypothetical protein
VCSPGSTITGIIGSSNSDINSSSGVSSNASVSRGNR